MVCPVCNQEGQRITCIAGNKESEIVYHPQKVTRNICNLSTDGADGRRGNQVEAFS